MMISGLTYIENFISEDQQKEFVSWIDSQVWSDELKRRVQQYGYKYHYTNKLVDPSMKTNPLPDWMFGLNLPFIPDQAIINEYTPGQGIYRHVDCVPCFKDIISSVSLLSGIEMEFTSLQTGEVIPIYLQPRSILTIEGEARFQWMHGIQPRKVDGDLVRSRRISLTFRQVII